MAPRLLAPLVALAAGATLAACGHGSSPPPATAAASTPAATSAGTGPAAASTAAKPAATAPGATTDPDGPPGAVPVEAGDAAVVRAWSAALNRNDNRAAARLFAEGAIVYDQVVVPLRDLATATAWNDGLPCGGTLVDLRRIGRFVVGTFRLTERPLHRCDAPGALAAAAYDIRDGLIRGFGRVPPYGAGLDVPDTPPGAGATTGSIAI